MQVIGICRFSYLALGGFQIEHEDLEKQAAFLYAPERIEERFRMFEALTLPSIRAQTDPDFKFLVVTGDALPRPYRDRLADLLSDIPQARIQSHAPGHHRKVMQAAINSVREDISGPCAQFRMDDDDAISRHFVARLREKGEQCKRFLKDERHIAVDFNQGYGVMTGPDGIHAAPMQEPMVTAALAVIFARKVHLSVMNFNHVKLPRFMTTVSFTAEDMYLRGFNEYNDSVPAHRRPKSFAPLDAEGEARFRDVFGVDAREVAAIYRRASARSREKV